MISWQEQCRRAKTVLNFSTISATFLFLVFFGYGSPYFHGELNPTNYAAGSDAFGERSECIGGNCCFYQHLFTLLSTVHDFLEVSTLSPCGQEGVDFTIGSRGLCETQGWSIRVFHFSGCIGWFEVIIWAILIHTDSKTCVRNSMHRFSAFCC